MITYRFLSSDEYQHLRPVFEAEDSELPEPHLSAIYAAFDGDKIVAFQVLQLVPHADPRWVAEDYRGKISGAELQRGIESLFDKKKGGSYYVFPSDARIAKLCRRGGMVEMPEKAWRKDLEVD